VALQIPITFETGGQTLTVTTPDTVLQSHKAGYAVHVWLSNDEENAKVYKQLLGMCVDGIMAAKPKLLEKTLRRGDVVRPGGRGTDPCSVRAKKATLKKRSVAVSLVRRGVEPKAYKGTVRVRAAGKLLGHESFSLPKGTDAGGVTVPLSKAGKALLKGANGVRGQVVVTTRGARGEPVVTRVRLHR